MMTQEQEKVLADKYKAQSKEDNFRGKGWCRYELNGWIIWEIKSTTGITWQCAKVIDRNFCDHTPQSTLEKAFIFAQSQ
jgi:hypothetical protein